MNQSQLIETVASKTGVTKAIAKQVIDSAITVMGDTLHAGDEIGLPALGKFKVKATAPREGRNPATGDTVQIPAGRKVAWATSKGLKTRMAA